MGKLKPLTDSKNYSDFHDDTERALEKLLSTYMRAIDIVLGKLKAKTIQLIAVHPRIIDREFALAGVQLTQLVLRLRKETQLLAHHGEAEAIARALVTKAVTKLDPTKSMAKEMPSGGNIGDRMELALSRIRRKIDDALQLSKVLGETTQERVERVSRAFPAGRKAPQTTYVFNARKLKEASGFFTGFATQSEWQNVLDDYMSKELPANIFKRGPEDRAIFYDVDPEDEYPERWAWEVEQEVTEDFVRNVRENQNEAAVANGIADFEWVAVIDSKTDDCCADRDGFTSAEIEAKLDSGDLDSGDSDAIVAPAHFNCRCKSVPMSADMPEVSEPDYEGFDDWLNQKAAS